MDGHSHFSNNDTVKYPSLPSKTFVDYIAEEGWTYISITGPASECKESFSEMWDSTSGPSSSSEDGKLCDWTRTMDGRFSIGGDMGRMLIVCLELSNGHVRADSISTP